MLTVVVGLLLLTSFVQSICITTANFDDMTVHSGIGEPELGWGSPNDPNFFSNDISVAQFTIRAGTRTNECGFYGSSGDEFFSAPKLSIIQGEDVIDPVVFGPAAHGYFFDSSSYWEEVPQLIVHFNCQKTGQAILSFTIDTIVLDNPEDTTKTIKETLTFYFGKTCETNNGYIAGFFIGKDDIGDVVSNGVVQSNWMLNELHDFPMVISQEERLSVFRILMSSQTHGNQFFYTPEIFVGNDDLVEVQVRGAANGGIATIQANQLVLFYNCIEKGETAITVSIFLGTLFGTLRFGFTKVC